jgi:hypothetical protein
MAGCQRDELIAPTGEEWRRGNQQGGNPLPDECLEARVNVAFIACAGNVPAVVELGREALPTLSR